MKTVVSSTNSNVVNNTTNQANSTIPLPVVPKSEPVVVGGDETTANNNNLQFLNPNTVTVTATTAATVGSVANATKRPASLDLKNQTKKRLVAPGTLVVDSPDLVNPKTVNTPDLEKIVFSMPTPQPGSLFPVKPGPVTSEQEAFGKGFDEALHTLRTSEQAQAQQNSVPTSNVTTASSAAPATAAAAFQAAAITHMSGGSFTSANMDIFPVSIKDEPQNPPASPSLSPIDMETQEKIKLERKRQRNRVAASKCRKRKLERISKLQDKVTILKGENNELAMIVKNLKDHVAQLKQEVMQHVNLGCAIYNERSSLPSNK